MTTLRRRLSGLPWLLFGFYAAILFGALYLFGELAGDVYERERIAFDAPILTWLDGVQTPALTTAAHFLSFVGSVYVLAPVGLLLAVFLWRRVRRAAIFFMLAFGGAVALNLAAKALFARVRPDLFTSLSPTTNYSFPSGHTMGSTAFFLALYLIARHLAPRSRWWIGLGGLVLTLGISLSRPYLQVHYPSDILAGWALSVAWVLGVNLWYASSGRARSDTPAGQGVAGGKV